MILSAGLSPAWQQTLVFDSLKIGEVNRARESHWCASGKVINVAKAVAALGGKSVMICSSGGVSGEIIEREMSSLAIDCHWIRTQASTRVCTTLLDQNGQATELVENTADMPMEEIRRFIDETRPFASVADVTVLTGSMPGNAPNETFAHLMRNTTGRFILDIRGEPLKLALSMNPFLVKPNREELSATVGRPLESEADLLLAMRELNDWGAAWVAVSDGSKGLYLSSEEEAFRLTPAKVRTRNPIGCGDCLTAGIAHSLQKNASDVVAAVRFGMGAAAENAEQLLPACLTLSRTQELASQVAVEELKH